MERGVFYLGMYSICDRKMDRVFVGRLLLLMGGMLIIAAGDVGYSSTAVNDRTGVCTVDLPVLDIADSCRNVEMMRYAAIGSGVVGLVLVLVPFVSLWRMDDSS